MSYLVVFLNYPYIWDYVTFNNQFPHVRYKYKTHCRFKSACKSMSSGKYEWVLMLIWQKKYGKYYHPNCCWGCLSPTQHKRATKISCFVVARRLCIWMWCHKVVQNQRVSFKIRGCSIRFYQFLYPNNPFQFSLLILSLLENPFLMQMFLSKDPLLFQILCLILLYRLIHLIHLLWWRRTGCWISLILWWGSCLLVTLNPQLLHLLMSQLLILLTQQFLKIWLQPLLHFHMEDISILMILQ